MVPTEETNTLISSGQGPGESYFPTLVTEAQKKKKANDSHFLCVLHKVQSQLLA